MKYLKGSSQQEVIISIPSNILNYIFYQFSSNFYRVFHCFLPLTAVTACYTNAEITLEFLSLPLFLFFIFFLLFLLPFFLPLFLVSLLPPFFLSFLFSIFCVTFPFFVLFLLFCKYYLHLSYKVLEEKMLSQGYTPPKFSKIISSGLKNTVCFILLFPSMIENTSSLLLN